MKRADKKRRGFIEIVLLVIVLVVLLKVYIAYRAWNMIEEKIRKDSGLPAKATPTEVISDMLDEQQKKKEISDLEERLAKLKGEK